MFISPIAVLKALGGSGASKLREHFIPSVDSLKERATAKNIAFGTFAASAVAAALIHPTSRMVLCSLLGMTYTMSIITFHLAMIGLYLGWVAIKGAGSVLKEVVSTAQSMNKAPVSSEKTQAPQAPKPPEMVDEYLNEFKQASKNAGNEWAAEYQQDEIDLELGNFDKLMNDGDSHLSKVCNESQPKNPAPRRVGNFSPNDIPEYLNGFPQQTGAGNPLHGPKAFFQEGAKLANEFLVEQGEQMVPEFLNFVAEEKDVKQFMLEEARRTAVKKIGKETFKYAAGAFALGGGVLLAYKLYREMTKEEKVDSGQTIANVSSKDLPEAESYQPDVSSILDNLFLG